MLSTNKEKLQELEVGQGMGCSLGPAPSSPLSILGWKCFPGYSREAGLWSTVMQNQGLVSFATLHELVIITCKFSLANDRVLWWLDLPFPCLFSGLPPWLFTRLMEEKVPALVHDHLPCFLLVLPYPVPVPPSYHEPTSMESHYLLGGSLTSR